LGIGSPRHRKQSLLIQYKIVSITKFVSPKNHTIMRQIPLRISLYRRRSASRLFSGAKFQDARNSNDLESSTNSTSSLSLIIALMAGGSIGAAAYFYRDHPANPLKPWIGSGDAEVLTDALNPPKTKPIRSSDNTITTISSSSTPSTTVTKDVKPIVAKEVRSAPVSLQTNKQDINAANVSLSSKSTSSSNTDEFATLLNARIIALKLKKEEEESLKKISIQDVPSSNSTSPSTLKEDSKSATPASENPIKYVVELPPALSAMLASHQQVTENLREILKEVDQGLAVRVDDLTETQLRARVVRLADELRDRARLEAVRTAEFLERNERLWLNKLNELASSSEAAFTKRTEESEKRLRHDLKKEHEERLEAEMKIIASSFEQETNAKVLELKRAANVAAAANAEARLTTLRSLEAKVKAHESLLAVRSSYEKVSSRVHRIELAISALSQALERSGSVTHEISAIQTVCDSDPVLLHAVKAFPREIYSKRGIPTRYELQGHFSAVLKEARRSALTPEAVNEVSGFLGKAFGQSVASVALPATQAVMSARDVVYDAAKSVKDFASESSKTFLEFAHPVVSIVNGALEATGLKKEGALVPIAPPALPAAAVPQPPEAVQNAASTAISAISSAAAAAAAGASDINRVGSIFDKAESAVTQGDLNGALIALSALDGHKGGVALAEWSDAARKRIQTDSALSLLKARLSLLSASLH
jgi:hypothetical protein